MLISRSCSWCHEINPATERYCRSCSHEAHVARMLCQCPHCSRARHRGAITETPVPLAGAIAAALAALRSGSDATDTSAGEPANTEGAFMNAHNENAPATIPATREMKRTPVSPELAAKIRAFDDALGAEFGFDVCYVVLARGHIVAASNARDGFVPPLIAPSSLDGAN